MNKSDSIQNLASETTSITVRPSRMAVGEALGVDDIIAQVQLIQNVMAKVMHEGEHYGTIPGCGPKKTLLQPGAQKLTMTFRLCPEYEIQETDLARGHKEYRIICTLKSMGNGSFVGQGVGCCSTMESKYRYRGGARKCPTCGKETIIKGKAEYGGGWLCYQKKGGCGAKWPDGDATIEGQSVDKVENDNPADTYNTVLKMAKKRAFVDATITATAASDIFTQDVGDDEENITPENTEPAKPAPVDQPKPAAPAETPEQKRQRFIAKCIQVGGGRADYAGELFREMGILLPTESLNDFPLAKLPKTKPEADNMFAEIAARAGTGNPPEHKDTRPAVTGILEEVKVTSGKSPKTGKPWTRYALKLNGETYSSFDKKLGVAAQAAQGQQVTVIYEEGERGNDAQEIIIEGVKYPEKES